MSNRLKLLRDQAVRPRRTVPVLLDGVVREQIEAVEDELDRLDVAPAVKDRRMSTKSESVQRDKLVAELDGLYESAAKSTLYVVLEAMQRTPYRALVAQHPPRIVDGKTHPSDLIGANTDTLPVPLIRACIIGHKATDDAADTEVLPLPQSHDTEVSIDWLLGHISLTDPDSGEFEVTDPFLSDRQIEKLWQAAFAVNRGDDAVPLRRKRSGTTASDAG